MDICITCWKKVEFAYWGNGCKIGHTCIHPITCFLCGAIGGALVDDDYCVVEMFVCPDCITKGKQDHERPKRQ